MNAFRTVRRTAALTGLALVLPACSSGGGGGGGTTGPTEIAASRAQPLLSGKRYLYRVESEDAREATFTGQWIIAIDREQEYQGRLAWRLTKIAVSDAGDRDVEQIYAVRSSRGIEVYDRADESWSLAIAENGETVTDPAFLFVPRPRTDAASCITREDVMSVDGMREGLTLSVDAEEIQSGGSTVREMIREEYAFDVGCVSAQWSYAVREANGSVSDFGTGRLTLESVDDFDSPDQRFEVEANDDFDSAQDLPVGGVMVGDTGRDDAFLRTNVALLTDIYQVVVDTAKPYDIAAMLDDSDFTQDSLRVWLFGADRQPQTGAVNPLRVRLAPGVYYVGIEVRTETSGRVPYALSIK